MSEKLYTFVNVLLGLNVQQLKILVYQITFIVCLVLSNIKSKCLEFFNYKIQNFEAYHIFYINSKILNNFIHRRHTNNFEAKDWSISYYFIEIVS